MSLLLRRAANQNTAVEPPVQGSGGDGRIGFAVRPTKVYRPFDRDIEAIQSVLESVVESPKQQAKPKRKREIVRAIVAEASRIIEGEGLIANAPVRQEIKQATFDLVFPAFEAKAIDADGMRMLIEQMLNRAAEAAYEQQLLVYEQAMAFEADEEEALWLLLAA